MLYFLLRKQMIAFNPVFWESFFAILLRPGIIFFNFLEPSNLYLEVNLQNWNSENKVWNKQCLPWKQSVTSSVTQTCFIYILDSSFSSSSKLWSCQFPSCYICSYKSSWNDNWNDWMLSFEIAFHCTAKEMGAKAAFIF